MRPWMKKILLIWILITLGIWSTHADLSESLFCLVKKDQVIISLKQTAWYYNCKDTILSLEHLIISTAKDLMKVQQYVTNGRDIEYRKTIRTGKQNLLNTLQLSRTTIITNMKTFQASLLQKSIQYFIIKVTPYKISIQKSLNKIQLLTLSGFTTPALNSYTLLLKAQAATIEKLSKVTTQAELTDLLAKYVYLKKEIAWKSE